MLEMHALLLESLPSFFSAVFLLLGFHAWTLNGGSAEGSVFFSSSLVRFQLSALDKDQSWSLG